ncbi:MAG: triose-phosphate isomerase [Azospira oryzae]|uniref:Triosephosphate isomerase n=1 Tax=Pelomicrobium methylotrophicum TaxID=2602750 RepID=A0A5C7ET56_9PROT|nr:triose-phosphate isomerase [Pelomicrobium methylotrophicum]PZP56695.1 MAG: triose-phosphate isomerase [Azospira oryzae]PZP78626.1 MAG: triose-phosphate isomerase [Azospira oryzae]TXF11349.1 triose-phosphate isomerase [Pelomicrobium methylotrophicum]
MRYKLVAGNWKMHGSLAENQALLEAIVPATRDLARVDVAVCVPFPYLQQVRDLLAGTHVMWGAQDASRHAKGAFTGEVSADMIAEFGARYVIVGHSERRTYHQESDALVGAKCQAVLGAGLTPIVCVGETLEERERGATEEVVARQLEAVVDAVGAAGLSRCVLAYEPVWAIGTGKTAAPEQAQEVHAFLRRRVAERDSAVAEGLTILYGGSVKGASARALFSMPDIDGGLIGGASLVSEEFVAICKAAQA